MTDRKVEFGGYMVPAYLVKGESADSLRVGIWLAQDLTEHASRLTREGKVADAIFVLDVLAETLRDAMADASYAPTQRQLYERESDIR